MPAMCDHIHRIVYFRFVWMECFLNSGARGCLSREALQASSFTGTSARAFEACYGMPGLIWTALWQSLYRPNS